MERFEGFPPRGLRFLRDLAKNNDRAWFLARKHIYEEDLLLPMQRLVNELSNRFERKRIPVYGDLRRSIFRIYRDVRFSKNKLPYKTHFAAYLSPDGGRHTPGGLYIHVTPKEPFLSLAFYDMHPKLLQRWRIAMSEDPKDFTKVIRALKRTKLELIHPDDEDDSLQRMPRGFTHLNDTPLGPYFRLRNFLIHDDLPVKMLSSRALVERSVRFVERCLPLLAYGWRLAAESFEATGYDDFG
ncbi:MAG TPA: DUF2461 domain-containing protein [Candidatus Baltobacteraceae bacterium]|jgi:uncharacterized protein (TIGR02453 family)